MIFEELDYWEDIEPHPPALQMAVDEALLLAVPLQRPLLRHYRWLGRAASFGVSHSWSLVHGGTPGFELVRRWTGGGIVRHDADWTFSLLVPAGNPFTKQRARESYALVHSAVGQALEQAGLGTTAVGSSSCGGNNFCFAAPVEGDLIDKAATKICGGAQRRTRAGLLHQGSIQNLTPPADFCTRLAKASARDVFPYLPPANLVSEARTLAQSKYATDEWMKRVA